jgi:hypothetical protein
MENDRGHDELGNDNERRSRVGLSDPQFRELKLLVRELHREAAAELVEQTKRAVLASLFEDVGRGTVTKILSGLGYILVVIFVATLVFLIGKEHIQFH